MSLRPTLFAFACCLPALAYADTSMDASALLARVANAARKLSYTGTFVYQSGTHTETSRITHIVDGRGEREKLEVLDGSPREVIRTNDEVRCFLPEQRLVIVERPSVRRAFPGRLPLTLAAIADSYQIRKGDVSRVADRESQLLILEPRDSLRYGHLLWADVSSGLLLKARMVDQKDEPIEQFYFTSVQIGGAIDKESVKPKSARKAADWHVHDAKTVEADIGNSEWQFKVQPAGFKQSAGMWRQLRPGAPDVMHVVFSDGLAAMSVFIEPLSALSEPPRQGIFSTGAINVYKRVQGDHLLTILGEVPPQTLKMLGDGVEARSKR
jgi:sigma-E factor negative regulatory protein RseB